MFTLYRFMTPRGHFCASYARLSLFRAENQFYIGKFIASDRFSRVRPSRRFLGNGRRPGHRCEVYHADLRFGSDPKLANGVS